jgi:segregation and condensation protein B
MMESRALEAVVEAIVLTARGPVSPAAVAEAVAEGGVSEAVVSEVLEQLRRRGTEEGRGVRLETAAGGWRCVTTAEVDPYLRAFHGVAARQRLSQAALEVLAIVAHRQPVTLPEISFIRGTGSSGVVRTLVERGMVRVCGRKQVVGRPFLYRTSKEFLLHFGLDRVEDLPDPEELLAESSSVAE